VEAKSKQIPGSTHFNFEIPKGFTLPIVGTAASKPDHNHQFTSIFSENTDFRVCDEKKLVLKWVMSILIFSGPGSSETTRKDRASLFQIRRYLYSG